MMSTFSSILFVTLTAVSFALLDDTTPVSEVEVITKDITVKKKLNDTSSDEEDILNSLLQTPTKLLSPAQQQQQQISQQPYPPPLYHPPYPPPYPIPPYPYPPYPYPPYVSYPYPYYPPIHPQYHPEQKNPPSPLPPVKKRKKNPLMTVVKGDIITTIKQHNTFAPNLGNIGGSDISKLLMDDVPERDPFADSDETTTKSPYITNVVEIEAFFDAKMSPIKDAVAILLGGDPNFDESGDEVVESEQENSPPRSTLKIRAFPENQLGSPATLNGTTDLEGRFLTIKLDDGLIVPAKVENEEKNKEIPTGKQNPPPQYPPQYPFYPPLPYPPPPYSPFYPPPPYPFPPPPGSYPPGQFPPPPQFPPGQFPPPPQFPPGQFPPPPQFPPGQFPPLPQYPPGQSPPPPQYPPGQSPPPPQYPPGQSPPPPQYPPGQSPAPPQYPPGQSPPPPQYPPGQSPPPSQYPPGQSPPPPQYPPGQSPPPPQYPPGQSPPPPQYPPGQFLPPPQYPPGQFPPPPQYPPGLFQPPPLYPPGPYPPPYAYPYPYPPPQPQQQQPQQTVASSEDSQASDAPPMTAVVKGGIVTTIKQHNTFAPTFGNIGGFSLSKLLFDDGPDRDPNSGSDEAPLPREMKPETIDVKSFFDDKVVHINNALATLMGGEGIVDNSKQKKIQKQVLFGREFVGEEISGTEATTVSVVVSSVTPIAELGMVEKTTLSTQETTVIEDAQKQSTELANTGETPSTPLITPSNTAGTTSEAMSSTTSEPMSSTTSEPMSSTTSEPMSSTITDAMFSTSPETISTTAITTTTKTGDVAQLPSSAQTKQITKLYLPPYKQKKEYFSDDSRRRLKYFVKHINRAGRHFRKSLIRYLKHV